MDSDGAAAILAALGLKFVNVVVAAVTSFAALRFFEGLSRWEKWTTFSGGWALAAWGAAPVTSYFELNPRVEVGITLLLGMFGMALAAAAVRVIKETDWAALVRVPLRRNGDKPSGGDSK